jgi:hypothetical protein
MLLVFLNMIAVLNYNLVKGSLIFSLPLYVVVLIHHLYQDAWHAVINLECIKYVTTFISAVLGLF